MCGFKKQTIELVKFYMGLIAASVSDLLWRFVMRHRHNFSENKKSSLVTRKKGTGKILHRLVYVGGKNI